jgi:two-component system chemotaxis response regulator CheY
LEIKGHIIIGKACNGNECLEKFSKIRSEPDFIIMDHQMPIKNGIDTMKELLRMNPDLKIIFISGDKTVKNEAIDLGAVSFIQKPFNMQTFFHTISQLMI